MKIRLLILVILLVFVGFSSASAQYLGDSKDPGLNWLPVCIGINCLPPDEVTKNVFNHAISEPFDQSDSVIVGTVIQKENQDNKITYSINVDFYLKNKQSFDMVTATLSDATEPPTFPDVLYYNSPVFNEGDFVFVYLKKTSGSYVILPQSFALDKHEARGPPPTILLTTSPSNDKFTQGDEIMVSGQVRKAELYYAAKKGEFLDVKLTISDEQRNPVSSNLIGIDTSGNFQYVLQTSKFLPGQYDLDINYGPETASPRITIESNLKYWTPLKQFNSGVKWYELKCSEDKVIIQRDTHPACVNFDTAIILYKRGIATNMENNVWNIWAQKTAQKYFDTNLAKSFTIEENSFKIGLVGVRESLPPLVTVGIHFTSTEGQQKIPHDFWFGISNGDHIDKILELTEDGKTKTEIPIERIGK